MREIIPHDLQIADYQDYLNYTAEHGRCEQCGGPIDADGSYNCDCDYQDYLDMKVENYEDMMRLANFYHDHEVHDMKEGI